MNLTGIDRKLVDRLQAEFPLTGHPYADIGSGLDISEKEVIERVRQLKAAGIVRQIGPVFEAKKLGYQTTLVAMRVAAEQTDMATRIITEHPGISHGYERDHYFNLWFTLAVPGTGNVETELAKLAEPINPEVFFDLPAVRLFKLRVHFALGGNGQSGASGSRQVSVHQPEVELTREERLVINKLQQDLPLLPCPFAPMAARLDIDEDRFLSLCQSLKQRGIMRRFGAAVNHRKAGFVANAMTCWVASLEKMDMAGRKLASVKEVSHCYERKTNPRWPYNLFAMIHGHTQEACRDIADKVSAETGLSDYVMLFSTRELKKTRVKYLV